MSFPLSSVLCGSGGIRSGSVQEDARLSRGDGDLLADAAAQQVADGISRNRLPGGQRVVDDQAHPPLLVHVASLCRTARRLSRHRASACLRLARHSELPDLYSVPARSGA